MTTVNSHRIVKTHPSSSVGHGRRAIDAVATENDISVKQQGNGSKRKIALDEEIDSLEGEDDADLIFQHALVNSVLDTGVSSQQRKQRQVQQKQCGGMSPRSKARYGLRKRRRPVGGKSDGKDGSVVTSTSLDPGRTVGSMIKKEPDDFRNYNVISSDFLTGQQRQRQRQQQQQQIKIEKSAPPIVASLTIPSTMLQTTTITTPPPTTSTYVKIKKETQQQPLSVINTTGGGTGIIGNLHTKRMKPQLVTSTSATLLATITPTLPLQQQQRQQSMMIAPNISQGITNKKTNNNLLGSFSLKGTTSNTTEKKVPRKRKGRPPKNKKAPATTTFRSRGRIPAGAGAGSGSGVPNPLTGTTTPLLITNNLPLFNDQTVNTYNRSQDEAANNSTSVSRPMLPVPCPLPQQQEDSSGVNSTAKVVDPITTNNGTVSYASSLFEHEPTKQPAIQSRSRVFSVDLDPSTFDFSDLNSLTGGTSDSGSNNNYNKSVDDLPIFQGRDRAFSFEVFNFTGGDDLLPNPVVSSSILQPPALAPVNTEVLPTTTRRPRGDSIIFDPSSFQEGGIHEKNALEKARLKELLPAAVAQRPKPQQQQQHPLPHPINQMQQQQVSSSTIVPIHQQHRIPSNNNNYSNSQQQRIAAPSSSMRQHHHHQQQQVKAGTTSLTNGNSTFIGQSCLPYPIQGVLSNPSAGTISTAAATITNSKNSRGNASTKGGIRGGQRKGTSSSNQTNSSSLKMSTSSSSQIVTLPSSLCSGDISSSNGQSPPTFQMELLNKNGRIGIYLPEERRQRIARFHAKRKMRIWRKRIKYDCRKKLADSRPRIKGRFVKRSDVD